MFEYYSDIVSIQDVAEMLGISNLMVYKLVKNKEIKSLKIGRIYRIQKSEVIDYINRNS